MSEKTLTPQERRLAVIAEVKAELEAEQLMVATGNYFSSYEMTAEELATLAAGQATGLNLQPYVSLLQENCEVCLLAAMLLAQVKLFDGVSVSRVCDRSGYPCCHSYEIYALLEDTFPRQTLSRIEIAFERNADLGVYDIRNEAFRRRLASSYSHIDDPAERMLAICDNLLGNDGEFVPPSTENDEAEID